jgi:hypothetical protein
VGGNATHDLISGKCRECPERLPVQQPFEIGIAELFSFLVEYIRHQEEQVSCTLNLSRCQPPGPHLEHFFVRLRFLRSFVVNSVPSVPSRPRGALHRPI